MKSMGVEDLQRAAVDTNTRVQYSCPGIKTVVWDTDLQVALMVTK